MYPLTVSASHPCCVSLLYFLLLGGDSLTGGSNRLLFGPLSRPTLPSSVLACQLCERLRRACGRKYIQPNVYGQALATFQARARDQVAAVPVIVAVAERAKREQASSSGIQRYLSIAVTV